ncbi:MAG: signal peptide peptidase SppA [Planctomycetes bacterium]|nr:signal peptide peptidase SppA [Planctomycetota bacterium]
MQTYKLASALLAIVILLASGCSAPSLLITPVSGKRELQETVLQSDSVFAFDKIAVIEVSGMIQNSERGQFFGRGEQPVSLLLEQLDKARCDSRVKAVILRINSPGGTVVASELMHDEIMHFRKVTGKPVIAVQMDVAASGAYFISCACDEIVAQPSTVTGSIGVIMMTIDLSGTLAKIGVSTDAITSGVHKDSGSPFRPMRPEERQLFQAIIDDMYAKFVDVVVAGRPKLTRDQIRTLADGRVYTATQALQNGLIDRIATMRETVCQTKDRVHARSVKVVTYHRAAEYKPNYYAEAPIAQSHDVNFLKFDMQGPFTPPTPQFMYLWSPGQ